MQRCPNCGAYVMSDDNICPRCDHPLNQPADPVPVTETFDSDEAEPVETAESFDSDKAEPVEMAEETIETEEPVTPKEDRANLPTTRLPNALPIFRDMPARQESPAKAEALAADDRPINGEADEEAEGETPPAGAAVPLPAEDHAGPDDLPPDLIQEPAQEILTAPAAEEEAPAVEAIPTMPADVEMPAPADFPAPFDLPESVGLLDAASTQPHLEDQIVVPEPDDEDTSEMPTERLMPDEEVPFKADETIRPDARAAYFVPPAPYTPPPTLTPPPPVLITPPPVSYGYEMPAVPAMSAATSYLQQRVQAYRQGGYRLHVNSPYEATLSLGKGLGAVGWLLALVSIIGFFWYVLLMALGGFQRDIVDIVLESDGRIYEDGSGAAHIRRHRSRVGQRWAMFGVVIFVICLVLVIVLGVVAGIVLRNERYQAALREAYPAVTLFEEHFSATEADPADVSLAKDGAVAYAIVAGIALVGLWGGATLWVIGTIHAKTYRAHVPPLPGW